MQSKVSVKSANGLSAKALVVESYRYWGNVISISKLEK